MSPYLNEAQVTSGALSYAMGAGAAVVSTPYWHAQELLAGGRGRLFPFKDHAALSRTLLELCSARPRSCERVRDAAFAFAQSMAVAAHRRRLLRDHRHTLRSRTSGARRARATQPARASSLPELRLDHLLRMTDDTGIIQHATYSVPARRTGYCVDDNARALIVAVHADRLQARRTRERS